jgi:hypothetical protein
MFITMKSNNYPSMIKRLAILAAVLLVGSGHLFSQTGVWPDGVGHSQLVGR